MARRRRVGGWVWRWLAGLGALAGLMALQAVAADKILFEDGFESGHITEGRSPAWSWGAAYSPARTVSHMMYGEGDIYEVSDEQAHSGRYALRLNFGGRNGFCNVCGTSKFELQGVGTAAPRLIGGGGEIHLPAQAGSLEKDRVFYNRDDYFAKWNWQELRSAMQGGSGSPVSNSMGGRGGLSNGDTFLLTSQCGAAERRSDCDRAINYLDGVKTEHFPYGGVLSRRFYIYIPEESVVPENTLKLGYVFFKRADDQGVERNTSGVIVLSVQRNVQLEVSMKGVLGKHEVTGLNFKRNKWYYIEEVWKRESGAEIDDGEYWLFSGESGDDNSKPLVYRDGLRYGKLVRMSIHGNWQHWRDVSGYVYFDDIRIARERSGPVEKQASHVASPVIIYATQDR